MSDCNKEGKKQNIITMVSVLVFAILLVNAFFCVYDYGVTTDEPMQRTRSLVAYKHINKILLNRDVPRLEQVSSLEEFDHQYYGTAIQIPMVIIEDITGFTMTSRQIFLMRHCLTFLIVYVGYICLYTALKHLFGRTSWIPLIIIMMLFLYPRYFAFQFFDIKNMAFAGLSMITILATVKAVEKGNIFPCICFGMVSAITTNCRVMGIIYPVILLGFYLVNDLKKLWDLKKMFYTDLSDEKKLIRKLWVVLVKYISTIASFTLTWYIISPIAWKDPFRSFINTFRNFAHYEQWNGTMVFMGKLITCEEMPWFYLFVWFAISVPIITLLFFIIGNVVALVQIIKAEKKIRTILNEGRWPLFFMLIFWGSVFSVIILKSRIYATEFDREEWSTSAYTALNWIIDREQRPVSVGGVTSAYDSLSEEHKMQVILGEESPTYIIDGYRNVIGNEIGYDGYYEVYTITVDGYNVCSVFKKIE